MACRSSPPRHRAAVAPQRSDPLEPGATVMFPVIVIGVGLAGLGLTALIDGRTAAHRLLRTARQLVPHRRYYAALLIPPATILAALILREFVSPTFTPDLFPLGLSSVFSQGSRRSSAGAACLPENAGAPRRTQAAGVVPSGITRRRRLGECSNGHGLRSSFPP